MKRLLPFAFLFFTLPALAQLVEVSPAQIDFGSVMYGDKDSTYIEITNLSQSELEVAELEFFDVYATTPFYVTQGPGTIPAEGTSGFFVVYEPVHNIDHNTELVVKTTGDRGAVSVDLIGSCTYPMSYYNSTFNLMDEALESELKAITGAGYIERGYGEARDEMYMVIDNQKLNGQGSSQNRLTRVYIGTDAVGYTSRGDLFNNYNVNAEHTFPQGFFNSNLPMKTDLHHLYPTDVNANSTRGSLRFGEVVSNVDWEQGGSKRGNDNTGAQVFEPRDAQKGPSARSILYFVTRYQNYGGHLSELMETTLRAWSKNFPPTQVEKTRNDDIADYQNNRNPFVDYPQFIDRIHSFRLDENRPNVGELVLSHEVIDFGFVEGSETLTTFNLILTNIGERFIAVNDFSLDGSTAFSLVGDVPGVVHPGESESVKVAVNPAVLDGIESGTLHFNAANSPMALTVTAEGVLGLRDLSEADLRLVPNPAEGHFVLHGHTDAVKSVELFDALGRRSKSYVGGSKRFDLSGLSRGMYLVVVEWEDGRRMSSRLAVR